MTTLDEAAAHWQWALDAAARALDADRYDLPGAELAAERRLLEEQRRSAGTLLAPAWIAPGQVSPRMLGVDAGTQAVLLDLDGVLTRSDRLHAAAWAQALDPVLLAASQNPDRPFVPFGQADYEAYFDGRLREDGIRLFLAGRGLSLEEGSVRTIAARKAAILDHGLRTHGLAAAEGAARFLHAARLAHVRRAVVSASRTARPMLAHAGLADAVDAIVDAAAVRARDLRPRPAPDVLLAACELVGVEPSHAFSLTHTRAGVAAAQEIDMPVIRVETIASLLDPRLRAA